MAIKYGIYFEDVERYKDAVGTSKPVEIEVMNSEQKLWLPTRSLISREPMEGGEPAGLVGMHGTLVEEGEWYVKIVEELPGPLKED